MPKRKLDSSNENRGVTITDVAKASGVSITTVSRILNNKEYVADETRDRVNLTIQQLGFVAHTQARRLRGGASGTLALHYPAESPHQIRGLVETPYITGAASAAGEKEYFLNFLISQLTPDTLLNMYRSNQIDGMILLQVCMDDWRVNLLRESNYPFVMIGRCANLEDLTFIDLDFEDALLKAFEYMVSLGHQEIGFLTYPQSWRDAQLGPAIRAMKGYEYVLHKYDLQPYFRELEFNSVEAGFSGTNDLLRENPKLTAIITANHSVAAGSIKALTLQGYSVPENFSVMAVGFGEIANVVTPSLTALEWSSYEVSYQATILMTDMLANEELPAQQILVKPTLMLRQSTQALT